MEDFLSVKHVAQKYNVSVATIWRWANDPATGFPKPVSLSPGCTRWRLSMLKDWEDGKLGPKKFKRAAK
ncbi:MAG: helix-turn-helix transcriptional regulator [Alphaproteobacteria bacterium]